MPPLKYPTKPYFFMVGHYPEATPAEWILPQNLQPPKKKNIGTSTNNTTLSCRMQYAQTVRNTSTTVISNGAVPMKRCMGLIY